MMTTEKSLEQQNKNIESYKKKEHKCERTKPRLKKQNNTRKKKKD